MTRMSSKMEKIVTGQNQQSASEYALVLLKTILGKSPVVEA